MRTLSVIIILVLLVFSSGHAPASSVSDISPEALRFFHEQAAQGDVESQVTLGTFYLHGLGVQQDYAKARQWYEKAAAQGDALAQGQLGAMYAKGLGVPQDYGKAHEWSIQAAAQGRGEAQGMLGALYAEGLGVPQDDVRAYMWLSFAAANLTGNEQKLAAVNRDSAARRMTPAQIAEAHRLVQQCESQQFKGC